MTQNNHSLCTSLHWKVARAFRAPGRRSGRGAPGWQADSRKPPHCPFHWEWSATHFSRPIFPPLATKQIFAMLSSMHFAAQNRRSRSAARVRSGRRRATGRRRCRRRRWSPRPPHLSADDCCCYCCKCDWAARWSWAPIPAGALSRKWNGPLQGMSPPPS